MSKQMPTFDSLMNPLLEALFALGGSGTIDEIYEKVLEQENLDEEISSVPHNPEKSNQTEVAYRLAWARTYLKKFGFLENSSRGVWALTKLAKEQKHVAPRTVVKASSPVIGLVLLFLRTSVPRALRFAALKSTLLFMEPLIVEPSLSLMMSSVLARVMRRRSDMDLRVMLTMSSTFTSCSSSEPTLSRIEPLGAAGSSMLRNMLSPLRRVPGL